MFRLNRHKRFKQSDLNLLSHTRSLRVCGVFFFFFAFWLSERDGEREKERETFTHTNTHVCTHCWCSSNKIWHIFFPQAKNLSYAVHHYSHKVLQNKQETELFFPTTGPVSLSTFVLPCSSSRFSSPLFCPRGVWSKLMQRGTSVWGGWGLFVQQWRGLNWGIALFLNYTVGQGTGKHPCWLTFQETQKSEIHKKEKNFYLFHYFFFI